MEENLFQMASLSDWWNGAVSSKDDDSSENNKRRKQTKRLALVDVRSIENHVTRRIAIDDSTCSITGSCNETVGSDAAIVHLPFETLLSGERSCELPPRHVEFAILMDAEGGADHRLCIESFFGATKSKATQQSRKPWRVRQVLVASNELWSQALGYGILKEGPAAKDINLDSGYFLPLPRLWQPDPLVKHVLLPLLKDTLTAFSLEKESKHTDKVNHHAEIWDLGSGAGRDVCFLAEQLKNCQSALGLHPVRIIGIDNHKASAKRCCPFWAHRGVDDVAESRNIDLNKVEVVQKEIQSRLVVCFYAVRFLNRKLISNLANEFVPFPKGTLFAMSHFCKASHGASWEFDHPKEKHVLERKELRNLFEASGKWEVLHDEIAPDGDHGRTLIQFVVRRS